MERVVRPVAEEDADAIVALLNPIIRAGSFSVMDEPVSREDQVAFIRGFPGRGVYHVAVDRENGRVVGIQDVQPVSAAAAQAHVGEISTFVALDAHRRGVGRALTRATLRAAEARGFTKLMATVRADHPGAVAFYRSRGFTVIGTAHEHALVRGRRIDEVLLERLLP